MRHALVGLSLVVGALAHAEPQQKPSFYIVALSVDGKHVLLQELARDHDRMHLRVLSTDTRKVEADVDLPALASLPLETLNDGGGVKRGVKLDLAHPGLADDLRTALRVLDRFAFGAAPRVAAQPGGDVVVFNVGDYLYTSKNGVIGKRLANQASYGPWIVPDGKSIMFRMENGLYPGTPIGRYELYTAPLDGGAAPTRIPGTAGVSDYWRIGPTGNLRALAHQENKTGDGDRTCVVEVELVKPFRAHELACLEGEERLVTGELSTHARWAAFSTVKDLDEIDPDARTYRNGKRVPTKKQRYRFRVVDLEHGTVAIDDTREPMSAAAIDDDGLAVVERYRTTVLVDPRTKAFEALPRSLGVTSAKFRAPHELVIERDGAIEVVDVAKLGPRTPYRSP